MRSLSTLSLSSTVAAVDNLVSGNRYDLILPESDLEWQVPVLLYAKPRLPIQIAFMCVFRCGPGMRLGVKLDASEETIRRVQSSGMVEAPLKLSTMPFLDSFTNKQGC